MLAMPPLGRRKNARGRRMASTRNQHLFVTREREFQLDIPVLVPGGAKVIACRARLTESVNWWTVFSSLSFWDYQIQLWTQVFWCYQSHIWLNVRIRVDWAELDLSREYTQPRGHSLQLLHSGSSREHLQLFKNLSWKKPDPWVWNTWAFFVGKRHKVYGHIFVVAFVYFFAGQ